MLLVKSIDDLRLSWFLKPWGKSKGLDSIRKIEAIDKQNGTVRTVNPADGGVAIFTIADLIRNRAVMGKLRFY